MYPGFSVCFCFVFHWIFLTSAVVVILVLLKARLFKAFRPMYRVRVNEISEYGEACIVLSALVIVSHMTGNLYRKEWAERSGAHSL